MDVLTVASIEWDGDIGSAFPSRFYLSLLPPRVQILVWASRSAVLPTPKENFTFGSSSWRSGWRRLKDRWPSCISKAFSCTVVPVVVARSLHLFELRSFIVHLRVCRKVVGIFSYIQPFAIVTVSFEVFRVFGNGFSNWGVCKIFTHLTRIFTPSGCSSLRSPLLLFDVCLWVSEGTKSETSVTWNLKKLS